MTPGSGGDGRQEAVWAQAEDVARLARQLCQHREDAEDVAQSSLLKAAQHIDGFRGEASVRTWLHRITANECRMIRRRLAARSLDAILEGAGIPERAVLAAGADPASLVEERELARLVIASIAELPGRQRAAIVLSDGAGLTALEVARNLGVSVPAVRSLLVRARRTVRAQVMSASQPR